MLKYPVILVYWLIFSGLAAQSPVQHKHCFNNDSLLQVLDYRKKSESSLVLLENKNNLVPLINLDTLKIACLSVGTSVPGFFGAMLENYVAVDQFLLRPGFTGVDSDSLLKKLSKYNLIIAGIHSLHTDTAISGSLWRFLTIRKSSLVVCFGADTFVNSICCFPKPAGLIYVPFNDKVNQELSAQAIFGGIALSGKLFSDLGNCYSKGYGISTGQPIRLKYTMAEEAGLNSLHLTHVIDSIVNNALEIKAFPGCNVLIAKNGKVIFHKAYGYHTFEKYTTAGKNDIYDLASVTKVTAALPVIMKLVDDQKLKVDERFSVYWTDWKESAFHRSGKEDITVRELLAHQAGLTPYIPFFKESMKNGALQHRWYRAETGGKYNLAVAPGLYLRDDFRNKVYRSIRLSPLSNRGRYVYSDLFFILVPELVSSLSGVGFSGFLDSCFYKPLGANSFAFRPWAQIPLPSAPGRNFRHARLFQRKPTIISGNDNFRVLCTTNQRPCWVVSPGTRDCLHRQTTWQSCCKCICRKGSMAAGDTCKRIHWMNLTVYSILPIKTAGGWDLTNPCLEMIHWISTTLTLHQGQVLKAMVIRAIPVHFSG